MATAKRLPSGSWRVRILTHKTPDGKKHYKSFTAPTKKQAERMAMDYEPPQKDCLTLKKAMTEYIEGRSKTLSPRTISSYKHIRDGYLADLMDKNVDEITQVDIQRAINIEAGHLAPKTVRSIHGFLAAVMGVYRPDFMIRTALPKKVRTNISVPSEETVKRLVEVVRGTEMELPVLLAAFGPMRRGEICALRAEDIDGNTVHVMRNKVKKELGDGKSTWVVKAPKSYAGDRFIEYPDFVRKVWERKHIKRGELIEMQPDALTNRFIRVMESNNLPRFRFHDLRHYSASIQHALGVPDAYIMQRGGWESDEVLKRVYRHTMEKQTAEQSKKINDHFASLISG